MTFSPETLQQATEAIETVCSLIGEPVVSNRIDARINRSVASFQFIWEEPFPYQRFHDLLGEFVSHLYRYGIACPRDLSPAQARDEALALLVTVR